MQVDIFIGFISLGGTGLLPSSATGQLEGTPRAELAVSSALGYRNTPPKLGGKVPMLRYINIVKIQRQPTWCWRAPRGNRSEQVYLGVQVDARLRPPEVGARAVQHVDAELGKPFRLVTRS